MNAIIFGANFLAIVFAVFSSVTRATFICTQQGSFKDPDSADCTGLIYCDGELQPFSQQCDMQNGAPTYFWPEKQMCYSYYDCVTGSPPNNDDTNPCDGINYDTVRDKYSTDCSSYIECGFQYLANNIIPFATKINCQSGKYYRPGDYGCTSEYLCTSYQCQAEGYVQNPASSDCSSFISCETYSRFGVTKYAPSVVDCPLNTKFSPYMMKCDSYYACGGSDSHQGVDPCKNYNWQHPLAVNELQNNCQTFYRCQKQLNYRKNYDVIVKESCPTNTLFSPLLGKCYYNHVCTAASCSKDPCQSGTGRYVDFESSDCRTFLECKNENLTNDETYKPYMDRRYCAYGSFFNPAISDCDRNYVCPQSNFCYAAVPTTTMTPTTTTRTTPGPA